MELASNRMPSWECACGHPHSLSLSSSILSPSLPLHFPRHTSSHFPLLFINVTLISLSYPLSLFDVFIYNDLSVFVIMKMFKSPVESLLYWWILFLMSVSLYLFYRAQINCCFFFPFFTQTFRYWIILSLQYKYNLALFFFSFFLSFFCYKTTNFSGALFFCFSLCVVGKHSSIWPQHSALFSFCRWSKT